MMAWAEPRLRRRKFFIADAAPLIGDIDRREVLSVSWDGSSCTEVPSGNEGEENGAKSFMVRGIICEMQLWQ